MRKMSVSLVFLNDTGFIQFQRSLWFFSVIIIRIFTTNYSFIPFGCGSGVWCAGQKKLSKVIVPDKWKEGASNTNESGGRKINENKLLSKKNRFSLFFFLILNHYLNLSISVALFVIYKFHVLHMFVLEYVKIVSLSHDFFMVSSPQCSLLLKIN